MTTFLHAADLHLDSPLRNLNLMEEAPLDRIRGASRRALDNLVRTALEQEVDCVLLAGDIFDGDWKDYNTGLHFIKQMGRLREHGIRVLLVSGNHDAQTIISRDLPLPDNVHRFSSEAPETVRLDELGLAIHGYSYPVRQVTDNPVPGYPNPVPGLFNIGLLHTALSGRTGHEPYAPCSRADLAHKGYQYWALGHVHQREIVDRDPWIVFAGCIQGRHIREPGPHGAVLVQVEDDRVSDHRFIDLDVVRYQVVAIDCGGIADQDRLERLVRERLAQSRTDSDGRTLIARIRLTGESALHGDLLARTRHYLHRFFGLALDLGDVWIEKIEIGTRPVNRPDPPSLEGTPLASLLAMNDQDLDILLAAPEIQVLLNRLPPDLFADQPLVPEDPADRTRLLEEIRTMVLTRLMAAEAP